MYWATIIASTTVGTTLADFADRTLGIGYLGGSTLLLCLLLSSLFVWYRSLGSIDVSSVSSPSSEFYYWLTIMFSQTLGTALFWTAFILTRPLGAVVGDFIDKPANQGGLELSRYSATAVLLTLIVVFILVFPQRAASKER